MKEIQVGKLPVKVCEHKGDINYLRFVKFKQYAPQFWERMDSPLFAVYKEKILDFHNKGQYAQSLAALFDYEFAIKNVEKSYDAWMVCFCLITLLKDEDEKSDLNTLEIEKKIKKFTDQGITPDVIKTEVVNFMKASPETFTDHVILYDLINTQSGAVS
jgi:hypothetical protein